MDVSAPRHNDRMRPNERSRSHPGFTGRIAPPNVLRSSLRSQRQDLPRSDAPTGINIVPISVIIPAFNEEAGIAYVIEELKQVAREKDLRVEILVVDDGSSDATAAIARQAGARVVQHRNRRGYGAALNTGLVEASAETIVITDADGSYPAQSVPVLVSALDDAEMAVALRPRFSKNTNPLRFIVKIPLTWLSNYITGTRIPDLNSGMRAFRRDTVLPYLGILPSTFSWTTTITLSLLCDRLSVVYFPAPYRKRLGKSKFRIRHAALLPFLLLRVALLFGPLKVFVPLATMSFLYGAADLAWGKGVSSMALLAFTMCVLFAITGAMADVNSTFIRNISRHWPACNSSAACPEPRITPPGQHTSRVPLKRTRV
jgi:glycosyltransferase involved in cell wall biosynthesis